MKSQRGLFFVIDGPDATGKKMQIELLEKRMGKEGFSVLRVAFPRYSEDSSYLVRIYLGRNNPEAPLLMRSPEKLGPYFASLFYALDRREAAPQIRKALEEGTHVICDRYVTANMGHQGGLIADARERRHYYEWIYGFEYGICKLPKPDCTMFLRVPLNVAEKLLNQRLHQVSLPGMEGAKKDSLDDIEFQKRAHAAYRELAALYKNDFTVVACADTEKNMLSPEKIHERVWSVVGNLLKKA